MGYGHDHKISGFNPPEELFQESKNRIVESSGKRRRSNAIVAQEITETESAFGSSVQLARGMKVFHAIP